jgi:hypothetical protein
MADAMDVLDSSTVTKHAVVGFEIDSLVYATFKEFPNTIPVLRVHLVEIEVLARIILAGFEAN